MESRDPSKGSATAWVVLVTPIKKARTGSPLSEERSMEPPALWMGLDVSAMESPDSMVVHVDPTDCESRPSP